MAAMETQVLLLTGMTPAPQIFARMLPELPGAEVVRWLPPRDHESISDYTQRLAQSLTVAPGAIVCGVSFGGIVARELALRIGARHCVLISAPRNVRELPPWFRVFRPLGQWPVERVLGQLGQAAACFPARWRSSSTTRFTKLQGQKGAWHRWATAAVLRWQPSPGVELIPVTQVHGDRDTTFPLRYMRPDVIIPGGGHVLPLTHPAEIVQILRDAAADR
jgi:pimeloyl-ACP methyl ester carboxylesterase